MKALAFAGLTLAATALSGCSSTESEFGPGTLDTDATMASCVAPAMACGEGGTCVDTTNDNLNCGNCGWACNAGEQCTGGKCQCAAGLDFCGSACTDTQSDSKNCGQCGTDCGAQVCSQGACAASCAAGEKQCGSSCVNVSGSDVTNCGDCGQACAAGQACNAGTCGCAAEQTACGTQCCAAGQTCGASGQCEVPATPVPSPPPGGGGAPAVPPAPPQAGGAAVPALPAGQAGGGAVMPPGPNPPVPMPPAPNPPAAGGDPAGYWRYKDWAGCVWTGVGEAAHGTTAAPQDFIGHAATDPYCLKGTVGADYAAVALLGFNLAEPAAGTSCAYDPADAEAMGPPGVTLGANGIALDFVKQGADTSFTLRVQLQGPNGATDENERWCATIDGVQGKMFVAYDDFYTECWGMTEADKGVKYAGQPVSAVVFLVPGDPTPSPFDFCLNGFDVGTSAADAPDGSAQAGSLSGTVGSDSLDGDFERAKVVVDGEEYVIQNNNWGNKAGVLILDYKDNSFKVVEGTGNGGPVQGAPASFPSIFIGANGNTKNGIYSTSTTDNLPIAISQIQTIPTTFKWSGSTNSFNATYDVWFANSPPAGEYKDGIDGFVMVWLHKPGDHQPIGSVQGNFTDSQGTSWSVWVGPRGNGPEGPNNAPVVSYVAPSSMNSYSFDLKEFISDAVANHGLPGGAYLTDVFAGFEIWNGGAGGGLAVDEFTCKVNP